MKKYCVLYLLGVGCAAAPALDPVAGVPVVSATPRQETSKPDQESAVGGDCQATLAVGEDVSDDTLKGRRHRHQRAICYERLGRYAEATRIYQDLLNKNSRDVDAVVGLARLLVDQARVADAVAFISTHQQRLSDEPRLMTATATLFRLQGHWAEAEQWCRRAMAADVRDPAPQELLALIFSDQKKYSLAEILLQNLIKRFPQRGSLYVNFGVVKVAQADFQTADGFFAQALKFAPNDVMALANRGAIALRFKNYQDAVHYYEQAVAQNQKSCEYRTALGFAWSGMRDGKKAFAQFEKAQEMCSEDVELLFEMGNICWTQLKDGQCALSYFERYRDTKKNLAKDDRVFRFIETIKRGQKMAPKEGSS